MDDLVSTGWLAGNLDRPGLVVVDATLFLPGGGRDSATEFARRHIPDARFLDLERLSDPDQPAPHMLPSANRFEAAMADLGIGRDDRIIVYDDSPLHSAARGWFTLRHFGAERVAILDGGLGKWLAEGRPVASGPAAPRTAAFAASGTGDRLVDKAQILAGLALPLVDARGPGRFAGEEAEPRPGVAPGHIPGSRNLPYALLFAADGTFRPRDELRAAFAAAGIDPQSPFVASCGSGITAAVLVFAARLLGNDEARLYDGSWAEWGADPATPKALGPP